MMSTSCAKMTWSESLCPTHECLTYFWIVFSISILLAQVFGSGLNYFCIILLGFNYSNIKDVLTLKFLTVPSIYYEAAMLNG